MEFDTADLAKAVLSNMHDRHLGITPLVAADLALMIKEPRVSIRSDSPWVKVFDRLIGELRPQRGERFAWQSNNRQRVGLLLSASPLYSVLGIAQPIIGLAVEHIGRNFLFCEDAHGAEVTESQYEEYAQLMESTLGDLAHRQEPRFANFWRERALAMAGLSRQALPGKTGAHHLPRMDSLTLALIEKARPQVHLPDPPKNRPRRLPNARTMSRLHKLKEGGIDGIRVSRRAEDISSMLFSEYVRPKPVQADRLLNSGFLVTRREPKFESLRDVMIVALVPGELNHCVYRPLLKLAFYELAMNLGFMLCKHQLSNTVFRWVEGDQFGGLRDMAFGLESVPRKESSLLGNQPDAFFRHQFLTTMGWLPQFADLQAPYQRDHRGALATLTELGKEPSSWLKRAWRGLPQSDKQPPSASADRFGFVHVMVLAPEVYRYNNRSLNLANTRSLLGLVNSDRQSASLTVIPQDMADITGWRFQAGHGFDIKTFMSDAEAGDITAMAGRLTTVWLTTLLREIWRG